MRNIYVSLICVVFLVSCGEKQARRPISVKTTNTFLKESAKKNKLLLQAEEAIIDFYNQKRYAKHLC